MTSYQDSEITPGEINLAWDASFDELKDTCVVQESYVGVSYFMHETQSVRLLERFSNSNFTLYMKHIST